MSESYRTVSGHPGQEVGRYYRVALGDDLMRARFVELFGEPDEDHRAASDRHHSHGAPPGWEQDFVSSAATIHPAEDFAETFAYYRHIRATLDTTAAFTMAPAGSSPAGVTAGDVGFDRLVEWWLRLSWALNQINRSMGHPDPYPFGLPERVRDKIRFVHDLVVPG